MKYPLRKLGFKPKFQQHARQNCELRILRQSMHIRPDSILLMNGLICSAVAWVWFISLIVSGFHCCSRSEYVPGPIGFPFSSFEDVSRFQYSHCNRMYQFSAYQKRFHANTATQCNSPSNGFSLYVFSVQIGRGMYRMSTR